MAGASHPVQDVAPDGRGLRVVYEVRREPAYTPPPPTEETRLEVLGAYTPTRVEDGVLSAQAGEALRSLQAEDAARTASALAAIRAQDVRIDRETAAALEDVRDAAGDPPSSGAPAEAATPA